MFSSNVIFTRRAGATRAVGSPVKPMTMPGLSRPYRPTDQAFPPDHARWTGRAQKVARFAAASMHVREKPTDQRNSRDAAILEFLVSVEDMRAPAVRS